MSESISRVARRKVWERSDCYCEAMRRKYNGVYTRCWGMPIEVHHLLTRGRGGDVLDAVHETYHLIALCPQCHKAADGAEAYAGDLLIDGYVLWNADKTWPEYTGSDDYLSRKYPRKDNQ